MYPTKFENAINRFEQNELVPTEFLIRDWLQPSQAMAFSLELLVKLAEHFLQTGELRMAQDVVGKALKEHDFRPSNRMRQYFKLLQIKTLAAIRLGEHPHESITQEILQEWNLRKQELSQKNLMEIEPEMEGLFARYYKDLYLHELQSGPPENTKDAKRFLEKAHLAYESISGLNDSRPFNPWTAVNVATCAFLLGKKEECWSVTEKIIAHLLSITDRDYWLHATLAEVHLLRCLLQAEKTGALDFSKTESAYREAYGTSAMRWSNLQSTRRQMKIILEHFMTTTQGRWGGLDPSAWIDSLLPIPPVLIFAGHMIDQPDRATPRFPAQIIEDVKKRIKEAIQAASPHGPCHGFASCANGSDILFHEALQELGGYSHVIFPYNDEEFIQDSVANTDSPTWTDRLNSIRANAVEELYCSRHRLTFESKTYQYANEMMLGLGLIKAREQGSSLQAITVWDGRKGDGKGGTADNVKLWKNTGLTIHVIDINDFQPKMSAKGATPSGASQKKGNLVGKVSDLSKYELGVKAILFADIKGFTQFSDIELTQFFSTIWQAIGMLVQDSKYKPRMSNTWGDALYLVFDHVEDAGLFALQLQKLISMYKISADPHHRDTSVHSRIALHAGPIYKTKDEIMKRTNYFGNHVSFAARLEPVTAPGQIYTTNAFAAKLELEKTNSFRCCYLGKMDLAKNYGIHDIYRLYPNRNPSPTGGQK